MRNEHAETLERRCILDIVREYKEKGYKVLLNPKSSDIPDFLANFRPDIVAYGPEENVVVEVKSKSSLSGDKNLVLLSEAVNSVSGWRFELVVTNSKKTAVVGDIAEEPSVEELRVHLSAVRQLLSIQQKEAATLLVWAVTEASMRLLAKQQSIELESNSPVFVMKTLFSQGVLSRDDYELLQEAMQFRNSLAHGYWSVEPEQDYASKLVNKVEEFIQGISN